MKIKIALAALACSVSSVGAEAATYVQYTVQLHGSEYIDYGSINGPMQYTISDSITLTGLSAIDQNTSSINFFSSDFIGYPLFGQITFGVDTKISLFGPQPNGSQSLSVSLGNAVDGALTDFTTATGEFNRFGFIRSPSIRDIETIIGFSTSFSDTPFSAPSIVIARSSSTVPEPAAWTMMIVGFGAIGAAMRRRPRASVRFA